MGSWLSWKITRGDQAPGINRVVSFRVRGQSSPHRAMQRLSPGRARDHPVMDIVPNKALSLSLSLVLSLSSLDRVYFAVVCSIIQVCDCSIHVPCPWSAILQKKSSIHVPCPWSAIQLKWIAVQVKFEKLFNSHLNCRSSSPALGMNSTVVSAVVSSCLLNFLHCSKCRSEMVSFKPPPWVRIAL